MKTKVVVTLFSCDDGHFGLFNPRTQIDELKEKIKEEVSNIGGDFLLDNDTSLRELEEADENSIINLCEKISERGFLEVKELQTIKNNNNVRFKTRR